MNNEIAYGSKYDEKLTTTEIAARIREDIKAAIKAGELPKGTKVSVRTSYYSGGSSIDMKITAFPSNVHNLAAVASSVVDPYTYRRINGYTLAASQALRVLDGIADAYNFDGSDIQTDYFHVKFYGSSGFSSDLTSAHREQLIAAEAELLADMKVTFASDKQLFESQLFSVDVTRGVELAS